MNRRLIRAAFAAMTFLAAARADAQITTVIAAPQRADAKVVEAARRDTIARTDSIARVTLTDMKEWVDSAAASLAVRPDTGSRADTTGASATPAVAAVPDSTSQPARPASSTAAPEFKDGVRAPDTATDVPTVALVGGIMVLLGLLLRRRVPARARRE